MPIYEYRCETCGQVSELLVLGDGDPITCKKCGGDRLEKLMSAHSSLTTSLGREAPLPGGCCGTPHSCGRPGNCCS
ncbi:MAG TPA: FmdB family transcriptional regulator [Syntrophus sp. (in: bacteria)]|nr:FmdB family transcriptional regulator [Syntrophus sp. (in: bacteria)]